MVFAPIQHQYVIIDKIIDTLFNTAIAQNEDSMVMWIHDTDRYLGMHHILEHIKDYNQNNNLEWIVDISSDNSEINWSDPLSNTEITIIDANIHSDWAESYDISQYDMAIYY